MTEMMEYPRKLRPQGGLLFDSRTAVGRLHAVDSAKGIGILLVVFGHAWRGAQGAGLIADASVYRMIDTLIYAFHMPLFFFLSGLLFLETLEKHTTAHLLRGRITRLLWPMVLWSWLFFGLKFAAGPAVNSPVALSEFPIVPLPPYEHFWFLWALFLCQAALILAYAFPLCTLQNMTLRWGAAALAICLAVLNPFVPVPSLLFGPVVEHTPYFLMGIAMGGLAAYRPSMATAVVSGLGFVALLSAVDGQKASVLLSLALVSFAWLVWSRVDRNTATGGTMIGLLRYLGKTSMVIYLTHTIFSAAVRIGMIKVGITDLFSVLGLTLLIGLLGPLLVLRLARRLRLTRVLGF